MAKASGSIDLKSLKVAGESNKYVTYINDEGVRVHEANDTSNYSLVNASGMEVFQNSISVAEFGSSVRIGMEDKASIILSQDSIMGRGLDGTSYFNFQSSNNTLPTSTTKSLIGDSWASSAGQSLMLTCSDFSSGTATVSVTGASKINDNHTGCLLLFPYGTAVSTSSVSAPILPDRTETVDIYYSYNGDTQFTFYSPALAQLDYTVSIKAIYKTTKIAPGYVLGNGSADGGYGLAEGYETAANGNYSHAEGYKTIANGNYSHVEGYESTTEGPYAHAEGYSTTAGGVGAHAEGTNTEATGSYAHAEGDYTKAIGDFSHAEGSYTQAEGIDAHASGYKTRANGSNSCTFGIGTIATENNQMVIGAYNSATRSGSGTSADPYTYSNAGDYLFIVGNGTGDATSNRKNIFTVDKNGNVNIPSGTKYKINGTALTASDVSAVPTSDVSTTGGANKVIKSDSSGNIVITGNLTLGGHTTAIGSTLTATNSAQKSISADGSTTLATLSNLPIGTWVIECNIRFSNTANGIRRGGLLASGSSLGTSNMDFQVGAATTAAFVKQTFTKVITTTAATTYNLIGYSSVAVTVGAGEANIKAVRLC